MRPTIDDVADRFQEPLIADALRALWPSTSSFLFLLATLAWVHEGSATYPLGGSLPLAANVERRYLELGGEVRYGARVQEILVEDGRAVGVRLAAVGEAHADVVISAADGHATIFDMLGGRYRDPTLDAMYEHPQLFPPICFVGLGVARDFSDQPHVMSGTHIFLPEPLTVGPKTIERVSVRLHHDDASLAPPGKTTITLMVMTDNDYWCELREDDRERYAAEKRRVADAVITALDARYPGLRDQVEMVDVATPATLLRYTGNWRGSFEGWLPTAEWMDGGLPKTLPGLDGFFMCGQWVEPGGGIPTAVMSGRQVMQSVCRRDGVAFRGAKG